MPQTLRCPGCQAELTVTTLDAVHAQCPRCRSLVDLARPGSETGLTADAPLPTRRPTAKPTLDDDLPTDLRTLVRPDPLSGEWKAYLASGLLALSVFSHSLQGYIAFERSQFLRGDMALQLFFPAHAPLASLVRPLVLLHEVTYWPAMICFLVWLYQASSNLKLLQAAALSHTPGSAVVVYFVPLLNLYRPYFIMQEIWRGSSPSAVGNSLAWLEAAPSQWIRVWWFLFLAGNIVVGFGRNAEHWETQGDSALIRCAGHLCMIVAGVLLLGIIHAITARQRERYERLYADRPQV